MTTHEDPAAGDDNSYLHAVLADYAALRQERQNDHQVFAALMGLAFVLGSVLIGFLGQSCTNLPRLSSCQPHLWQPIYAFLPLLPLGVLAVFAEFSNVLVLRSYYMRAIEQELQDLGDAPTRTFRESGPMRYPSFGQLIDSAIYSPRTGFLRYSFLHVLLVVTLAVILVPIVFLSLVLAGPIDLQVVMGAVYSTAIAFLLRIAWATTMGGERFWQDATARLRRARRDATRISGQERSLVSYLVLPRPVDLLEKGSIIPLAWIMSAAVFGTLGWPMLEDVLAAMVVFELLLYQARYVLNDIRGLRVDGVYSTFKLRTRFPPSTGRVGVEAALVSAVVRLGLAVWLTARVVDPAVRAPLLVAAGALVVHTIAYEALRASESSMTGQLLLALTPGRAAIFLLSGVGSAIRACLGILLAQPHRPDLTFVALAAVTMTVFASMYVTMQWTLDALGQVAPDRDERLPTNRYRQALEQMSHLAALLRQARVLEAHGGSLVPVDRLTPDAEERMARSRALEHVSSRAWWNAMLVMAMPFATMVGLRAAELADARRRYGTGLTIAAGLLGLAGARATVLLYGGDSRMRMPGDLLARPSPARALLGVAITSAAVGLMVSQGAAPSAGWIASLPTALVGAVYVFYRHASRAEVLLDPVAAMRTGARVLASAGHSVVRVVVGPDASRLLEGQHNGSGESAPEDAARPRSSS
jgi:hypothetical protein